MVAYFLDACNFGSRIVDFDDTPIDPCKSPPTKSQSHPHQPSSLLISANLSINKWQLASGCNETVRKLAASLLIFHFVTEMICKCFYLYVWLQVREGVCARLNLASIASVFGDVPTVNSDAPDTPPSPTHDTPFTKITTSTQRSPVIPRHRVMILAPGHPIPHGRTYRYHPNGLVHMMTARKRVRPLLVQQLSVRHSVDHSLSDSSSRHSSSNHSSPELPSTSTGSSRKRRRSPMTFVPALPLVSGALSFVRADLIPSPKRVRDIGYLADVDVGPRDTRVKRVTHPAMPKNIPKPAQEGATDTTYETLGDLVQRLKKYQEKDKIGSKRDKNGKRGEAGKSQKQLQ
nr:hypothetical protein [Tanacetum cinerariifolium]